MTTLEMEAQKALWIRDILNIDNSDMITELKKNYDRTKLRILRKMNEHTASSPESKEYIMKGLKESFGELKNIQTGHSKGRPLEEVLAEIEADK